MTGRSDRPRRLALAVAAAVLASLAVGALVGGLSAFEGSGDAGFPAGGAPVFSVSLA